MKQTAWRMPAPEAAPAVEKAIRDGAWVVYSVSGGKDSSAAIAATLDQLEAWGHPRERTLIMHADLGRAEWKSTPAHVEDLAEHFGLPLRVVRHSTHDMLSRWERRGDLGRQRWESADTVTLIGPWSSAKWRFCTGEQKVHVMSHAKRHLDMPVVSIMGIRRQESRGRALTRTEGQDSGMKRYRREDCLSWNPIAHWSEEDVFAVHRAHGIPLHEAYGLGSTRLSCNFCVLANINDLTVSSAQEQNHETYRHLVGMEARYGFSFQPSRWLADVRPGLISRSTIRLVTKAKAASDLRRAIERTYPESYRKGFALTKEEIDLVLDGRRRIAQAYGLTFDSDVVAARLAA